jgi:hypothetical protein
MTDDQINAAIAGACGWTDIFEHPEFGLMGVAPETHGCRTAVEEYAHCLNAMHEAEKTLTNNQFYDYSGFVDRFAPRRESRAYLGATARLRAEAFLRTLGKWEEAK